MVSPTVLVVDDHASFRQAARAMLHTHGFDVVAEAEDLAGAVAAVRRLRPDVALVDIGLVDEDGFEVTEALLRVDETVRVVLVSSRDRTEIASRLQHSPALGFLAKDELSPSSLAEVLEAPR